MRVHFLPSSFGDPALQLATSLVVNDALSVDAGCLGFAALDVQLGVRDILLTHTHIDHVGSLPIFLVNMFQSDVPTPRILAPADVLESVRNDLFNDRLWPDLVRLSTPDASLVELVELPADTPTEVGSVRVTPIAINHVVPTYAYLLDEPGCSVLVVTDTGETTRVWECARECDDLAGVFIESAFPESQQGLARDSGHLTPLGMARQLDQIGRPVRSIVVHLNPLVRDILVTEIEALGREELEIGLPGTIYEF